MLVTGRIDPVLRAQRIRRIAQWLIVIALIGLILGFLNMKKWQQSCDIGGGTLQGSFTCDYPATYMVFGDQRVEVPATTTHWTPFS